MCGSPNIDATKRKENVKIEDYNNYSTWTQNGINNKSSIVSRLTNSISCMTSRGLLVKAYRGTSIIFCHDDIGD